MASIPFSTISIVIDKKALLNSRYKNMDILETAYAFLTERFDSFLRRKGDKGMIRVDRTGNRPNAHNAKDQKILDIINKVRRCGNQWRSIENIVEKPLFFDSSDTGGLQIADAVAYCTNRHVGKSSDFEPYWNRIYGKIYKSPQGGVDDYGLYCFPKL